MATLNPIIFIDLETGGLDVEKQPILEVACIVTDGDLQELCTFHAVAHYEDNVLDAMENWPKKQHMESGLIADIKSSVLTLDQIEQKLLDKIKVHVAPNSAPLAGSSVHFDRKFIEKYMPRLAKFAHYRNIDVSSIKELCKRWSPLAVPSMGYSDHRALQDIRASIKELAFYRKLLWQREPEKSNHTHIHVHIDKPSKRKKTEDDEEYPVTVLPTNFQKSLLEDYHQEFVESLEDGKKFALMQIRNFWSKPLLITLSKSLRDATPETFYDAVKNRLIGVEKEVEIYQTKS
jgi:oligoribonuclease